MSNRLRLLFHNALEGHQAHVGRHALKAMRRIIQNPAEEAKWIPYIDWAKMGRPRYSDKKLALEEPSLGPTVLYKVAMTRPPVAKIPAFDSAVEEAKWLWQHLPAEVRKYSSLRVTRENRCSNWRRSMANPYKHGFKPASAPGPMTSPAAPQIGAGFVFADEVPSVWSHPAVPSNMHKKVKPLKHPASLSQGDIAVEVEQAPTLQSGGFFDAPPGQQSAEIAPAADGLLGHSAIKSEKPWKNKPAPRPYKVKAVKAPSKTSANAKTLGARPKPAVGIWS